jgi:hypothetical protein
MITNKEKNNPDNFLLRDKVLFIEEKYSMNEITLTL